jgi:hypothetical protein
MDRLKVIKWCCTNCSTYSVLKYMSKWSQSMNLNVIINDHNLFQGTVPWNHLLWLKKTTTSFCLLPQPRFKPNTSLNTRHSHYFFSYLSHYSPVKNLITALCSKETYISPTYQSLAPLQQIWNFHCNSARQWYHCWQVTNSNSTTALFREESYEHNFGMDIINFTRLSH